MLLSHASDEYARRYVLRIHLDDWVRHRGQAVIIGLDDDGKPLRVGSHKGGEVGHKMNGRVLIHICDLQCFQ